MGDIATVVALARPRRRRGALPSDPVASAKAARCRHVDDAGPGIRRVRCGRGWRYVSPDGQTIHDRAVLARVKGLVIPPAWQDVWICPEAHGHIQATGRDKRGRKQYRYHARFREIREETKYEHMLEFAETLPRIRAQIDAHLAEAKLTRDKALATLVRLLELTLIRVGNEEYARDNGSFGLTTMRTRHVDVTGSTIAFKFRGKSRKVHAVRVQDRRLARAVQRFSDLPGQVLFQYVDDEGELRSVESSDVNDYLRRVAGVELTAKDFRTWAGTVLAAQALKEVAAEGTKAVPKKRLMALAVKNVSSRLGNTPAVCRRCYVHPEIFGAYVDGELVAALEQNAVNASDLPGLSSEEAAVLALLRARLAGKQPGPATPAVAKAADGDEEAPPRSHAA